MPKPEPVVVRLAMLDVDGTLRHADGWLPGVEPLLTALGEAGIAVALCSGRNTESLVGLAAEHPQIGYIASAGGSVVLARDPAAVGWRVLARRCLPRGVLDDVVAGLASAGIECWAYTPDAWLVPRISLRVMREIGVVGAQPREASLTGRDDVAKVLALPTEARHREVLAQFAARDGLAVVESNPDGFVDVVPAEAVAGKGGDVLTEHLGIDWSQVLAVGDGENDLGMLGRAGLAVLLPPLTTDRLAAPTAPAADEPAPRRTGCPDLPAVLRYLAERGVINACGGSG